VQWQQGAEADFPAAGTSPNSPAIVTVSDAGADLVFASTIKFLDPSGTGSYYNIQGATSSDQLAINPASATTVKVDNAADVATISADIVPYATGTTTLNTTGNSGTFVIDGAASVDTLIASAGNLKIDSNATVTAMTATASAGTLRVDGALNLADNGTGFSIENNATLQGAGTISLAGSALLYESAARSTFDGAITGISGVLDVGAASNAGLTLARKMAREQSARPLRKYLTNALKNTCDGCDSLLYSIPASTALANAACCDILGAAA